MSKEGQGERLQRGLKKCLGVMGMFAIWFVVMVSWVHLYVKTYLKVQSTPVWFIACQLNLNKAVKDYDTHKLSGPTVPSLSPELLTRVLHQGEVSNE